MRVYNVHMYHTYIASNEMQKKNAEKNTQKKNMKENKTFTMCLHKYTMAVVWCAKSLSVSVGVGCPLYTDICAFDFRQTHCICVHTL